MTREGKKKQFCAVLFIIGPVGRKSEQGWLGRWLVNAGRVCFLPWTPNRLERGRREDREQGANLDLPALFVGEVLVLVLGTGTAVTFFFTLVTDLFVVSLSALGELSGGRDRRVLTFPSGLLVGEFDVYLFVGLGGGLRFAVLVGRRKDAEGDRDACFKVQIDDFCWRERIFSYNLPWPEDDERKTRRILWLLFLETKVEERKGEKKESGLLCFFSAGFFGEACLSFEL